MEAAEMGFPFTEQGILTCFIHSKVFRNSENSEYMHFPKPVLF